MVSKIQGIIKGIGLPNEVCPPISLAGGKVRIEFEKVPGGDYHGRKAALLRKKKIVGALEGAGFELNFQNIHTAFIVESTRQ